MTVASPHLSPSTGGNLEDVAYGGLLARFSRRFDDLVALRAPLFTTDAADLWPVYLECFPTPTRKFHDCHACRSFIQHFGSLVVLEDGRARTAIWADDDVADAPEAMAFRAMRDVVDAARVNGVFLSPVALLGQAKTGVWRHLSVRLPKALLYTGHALTAGQAMAEKREDHKTVARALGEFDVPLLEQAVALLQADALYRTEKVLGPAEWLLDLARATRDVKGARRDNLIWSAIATAPAGFCHPRSSMIGTLLEDLEAGLPFDDVAAKFKAKMHPLRYLRPQTAPAAGTIAQAEKLVEKLGIRSSFERRFARLDEVEKLWIPRSDAKRSPEGSVFGHLTPKGKAAKQPLSVGATSITWEKFARTVLPTAESIEVNVPAHGSFVGVATAVHADAPPILQWDRDDRRNPFSWYVYHGGSDASAWGLSSGWRACPAVVLQPSMWHGEMSHQGKRSLFVLAGQRDQRAPHACLFPETLKSELHGIRAVVEAHSKSSKLQGGDDASANGLDSMGAHVRVKRGSIVSEYRIDRWD